MSDTVLSLDRISLELGGRLLLEDVDLQLAAGEIVTIVGPNGAGKTTLLRIALGLQKPTAGHVKLEKSTTIGYMPQNCNWTRPFRSRFGAFWP